jgi:hypothetical protein
MSKTYTTPAIRIDIRRQNREIGYAELRPFIDDSGPGHEVLFFGEAYGLNKEPPLIAQTVLRSAQPGQEVPLWKLVALCLDATGPKYFGLR